MTAALEGYQPDRGPETARTDAELIADVLTGHGSAFAELASRHRRYVNNLCHRFFRDAEIVRDLAQESFTKAFAALASYRAEMPFIGWLRAIVVNVCYDELRRRQRRPEELVGSFTTSECSWLDLVSDATPEQIVAAAEERNEAHNLAHRLLAMLRPEDRMVLTLKDSEDLSVAEIAAHLGWSEAKVKIRAFRARRLLRKQADRILAGRGTRSRSELL
jgi:RNA polymerase sigma-70 factor (ECF subfamily)